ncbi:hypothetical protein DdX_01686 [Ditylenchus destructor]|uniref:Uncharacterized protein n=1 Tax=Ditylenchus destructor TaxID=166010 RepID=A0AAD4NMA0_9BILA|nr:hypothetical protein DdX_01686 [Ditylenchus destructor]
MYEKLVREYDPGGVMKSITIFMRMKKSLWIEIKIANKTQEIINDSDKQTNYINKYKLVTQTHDPYYNTNQSCVIHGYDPCCLCE